MHTVLSLSCVTWNIHRACGRDGRFDPARTLRALTQEVCADAPEMLVLQEADAEPPPHPGLLDLAALSAETGLVTAQAPRHARWGAQSHGFLGVVCFTRPPITVEAVHLLDLPGHCHRGAVALELCKNGRRVRVIGTHLSLGQPARIAQMRTLGQYLNRQPQRPTLLIGDLNEWRPWGGLALGPAVLGRRFAGPARATFPVRRPVLPLDRVLAADGAEVTETRVLDGPGIRSASDHRPLAAKLRLPPGDEGPQG